MKTNIFHYAFIGAVSGGIQFLIIFIGNLFSAPPLLLACIAYTGSTALHFLLNRRFIFKEHKGRMVHHITSYLFVILVNLFVTIFITYILVNLLGNALYESTLVSICVTFFIGYHLIGKYVFKK